MAGRGGAGRVRVAFVVAIIAMGCNGGRRLEGTSPSDGALAATADAGQASTGGSSGTAGAAPADGATTDGGAPDATGPGGQCSDGGAGGMLGTGSSCAEQVAAAANGICYGAGVRWCWENPIPTGEDILALGGTSVGDVWVLTPSKILHGVAGVWTDTMDARFQAGAFYTPSANDVWLAGGYQPGFVEAPANGLAEDGIQDAVPSVWHWDGTAWTQLTTLTVAGSGGLSVTGIWGSSDQDVYVTTSGLYNAGLFHFDGQQWGTIPVIPDKPTASFEYVWGSGPKDVWAVALAQPGSTGSLYHFDGASWQPVPVQTKTGFYTKVSGTGSGDLWIGSSNGVLRYDGVSATDMTPGPATKSLQFFTPLALGPQDVWALSSLTDFRSTTCNVAHWDGTRWLEADVQADPYESCYSTAMGWPRGGLIGGGRSGRLDALLCRGDFAPLARQITTADLEAVAAVGPTNLWAVGASGAILHGDGAGHWQAPTLSATDVDLHAVWGSSAENVWAVGEAGTALQFNGQYWWPRPVPTNGSLVAVSGTGPSDVWAVQSKSPGAMLHFDGTTWTVAQQGEFADVAAVAPDDVWAVGYIGFAHFDGTSWTTTPPLVDGAPPQHVKAFATDDVWADSEMRWVFHYDGKTWQALTTGDVHHSGKTAGYGPFITQIAGDATARHPYFLMHGEEQPDGDVAELADGDSLRRLPKMQTATAYLGIAVAGQNIWVVGQHGAIEHATVH